MDPTTSSTVEENALDTLPPPSATGIDAESMLESGVRPAPNVPPFREYVELDGGLGRDVYFRPDRYQRADLGPVGVLLELTQGDQTFHCELHDVSQNGIAFEWPKDVPVEIGTVLDEILLKFDEHEAYRGQARVSSVRRDQEKTIVGASLMDTLMNIEDVLQLRDVKAWIAGADSKGLGLADAPWRVPGQERFKALVAELRLFLEDAQARFADLEASLPWHVAHGEHDSPARDALIERVHAGFAANLVQASNEIDVALRLASRQEREALREYSIRHLHGILMQSPWMYRARHKPLGYPGDFETMTGLYANHFSGPTLFAKALNLAFVSTLAGEAVRTRKNLVKQQLLALLDAGHRGRPTRVLSIAAGPAQEVFDLLQECESIDEPLEIVLFDQDKRALGYSYARLKRLINARWRDKVKLVHLHDSIKRLLRGSTVFPGYGQFDAVYACGLFDYLQPHSWVSLCRSLYNAVDQGGTLFIGNMVPSNPSRWFMELHLDWFLVYRERSEMCELARSAVPDARIGVLEEPTGVNPFVTLTRE